MNYKIMGRFIAQTLFIEAVFMIPALIISLYQQEMAGAMGFVYTIAILMGLAGVLKLLCKGSPNALNAKEGLVCVALSWVVMSLIGCLPFVFSIKIVHNAAKGII